MLPSWRVLFLSSGIRFLSRFEIGKNQRDNAKKAEDFFTQVKVSVNRIRSQLDELARSGKRVVIWGGTGKGAAFMNHYGVDSERFPFVVDSDPKKVGTYVPGTGQLIQSSDTLIDNSAEVVIISTQWRAREILIEMKRKGIEVEKILIEHEGRLVDFLGERHPYRVE